MTGHDADNRSAHTKATTWQSILDRSPVVHIVRGLTGKPTGARRVVAESDLPDALSGPCLETALRTRLRRAEREDIARELVAHARDALLTGRDPADVAETLGEPRTVARLLRRGAIRKRSAFDRACSAAGRSLAAGFLCGVLFYTAFAARFYAGRPSVNVNYVAKLNAPTSNIPEQDRAWPLYKSGFIALQRDAETLAEDVLEPRLEAEDAEFEARNQDNPRRWTALDAADISRGHPDESDVRDLFAKHADALEDLRRASRRPVLGFVYSTRARPYEGKGRMPIEHRYDLLPPLEDPTQQEPAISILLPHLGPLRGCARFLALHALLAADDGDRDTVVRDLDAMLGLTAHARNEPFLIGYLVGVAIEGVAIDTVSRVLARHPDLLSTEDLATLAHRLAAAGSANPSMSLHSERYFMDDILQRGFTDDGRGGGRVTQHARHLLGGIGPGKPDHAGPLADPMAHLLYYSVSPATGLVTADRRAIARRYNAYLDRALAASHESPDVMVDRVREAGAIVDDLGRIGSVRYWPLGMMAPAMGRAIDVEFQSRTRRAACLAVLALHAYEREHQRFPGSLDELVPDLLPAVPEDPFNPGQPLRYTLTDHGPTLYSVGADGDDDQATPAHAKSGRRWPRRLFEQGLFHRYPEPKPNVRDGDVVLFPIDGPRRPN
ncbi:MAG: hypothetical protein AAF108_07810 [Planctomycetota bacterium]